MDAINNFLQQTGFAIGDDPLSSPDNARPREQTVFFRSHHKRGGQTFLHLNNSPILR